MSTKERIYKQEVKDLDIFNNLFKDITQMNGDKYMISGAPDKYNIDCLLFYTATTTSKEYCYDVELKRRNINCNDYPNVFIKKDKLNNIKKVSNNEILYVTIFNDSVIIHNLSKIDFNKLIIKKLKLKKVQYQDNSDYQMTEVYMLPIRDAIRRYDRLQ